MTNFVVGAVLARAALSFWLSTVIFAGDQFGVGCCAHVAWCALWLSWGVLVHKPYHCHRGFVLAVDGGAGGWWSPVLLSNLVIPAGCYEPRPVAAPCVVRSVSS